jgi:hypothetical protein
MNTYTATVRIEQMLVVTQVQAQTSYHANLLLQAQYGANSVVVYPQPAR